jgi:hypothetical protein
MRNHPTRNLEYPHNAETTQIAGDCSTYSKYYITDSGSAGD